MCESMDENEACFNALWREVVELHIRWDTQEATFPPDVDSLSRSSLRSRSWLLHVRRILIEDVYLAVARLTDPPSHGKHDNLSISGVLSRLKTRLDTEMFTTLTAQAEEIGKMSQEIRIWRNKRGAHNDLVTYCSDTGYSDPVPGQKVKAIVAYIDKIVNGMERAMSKQQTEFRLRVGGCELIIPLLSKADECGMQNSGIVEARSSLDNACRRPDGRADDGGREGEDV
jgi:hypothetical protein